MKKCTGLCLLICLLLTACQKPAGNMDAFNQKMDQLIAQMPLSYEQLNSALDNNLRPLTGQNDSSQGALTRDVMVGSVKVDVIWARLRDDTTYMYFEFSGNPCYSPDHFKNTYYTGQTPETALADGVSNIYRSDRSHIAVGLMTVERDGKECLTNIILRNGQQVDSEAPI